jgi:putative transposase
MALRSRRKRRSCDERGRLRFGTVKTHPYNPDLHHRRSIRLQGYDYWQAGAYFVTVCVQERECLFGEVEDGTVRLNYYGQIAMAYWNAIPHRFVNAGLDAFVIMPNHLHGILVLADGVGAKNSQRKVNPTESRDSANSSPLLPRGTIPGSLGAIVQNFKLISARKINRMRGTPGQKVWQRDFYDRILRNEDELFHAREYIALNPARWEEDEHYPHNQQM